MGIDDEKKGLILEFDFAGKIFAEEEEEEEEEEAIVVSLKDITDRVQAEEALRENEEKFRSIVENSHDGILIVDDHYRFVYVNDELCRIVGYPYKEIIGQDFRKFLDAESKKLVADRYIRRQRGEEVPPQYEFNVVRKAGEKRRVKIKSTVVKDSADQVRTIAQILDITEQRRAERMKSATYRIVEAAIAAEDIESLFLSIHGIIAELMPAKNFYIALYDAESNRLSFPYFVDEYDKKPAPKKLGKGLTEYVLRTGQPLLAKPEVLEEFVRKGKIKLMGTPSVDWLGVPLKTKDKTIGVLAVQSYSRDVRFGEEEKNTLTFVSNQIALAIERKQAEERIQRDLEERNILLKEIHHRVKNNLQVIKSLLSLQSAYVKDKDDLEMLRESQNRIQSMALVHEKLYRSPDLAKIEFGRYIEDITRALYRSYGIDPYKIRLNVKAENIRIGIDLAVPCGLIINELVSNALKYAFPPSWEGKGEIDVIIHSTEGGEIELIVRDNGIGFSKELDFRKTESLGLHLVHILAEEQLGGKIKLDRTRGTKFQIKFRSKEV